MPILQLIYRSKMSIMGVNVTVKIQFDYTSTCKYTQSYTPPLGHYAPSCVWLPLLKNYGSALPGRQVLVDGQNKFK